MPAFWTLVSGLLSSGAAADTEAMKRTVRTESHDSRGDVTPASPHDTRMALVERSGRSFAVVPNAFVQNPNQSGPRPGPLATFVRNGDHRGLNALLLLYTMVSSGDGDNGWSTTLPLAVWARAFDTVSTATPASANSAATKIVTRLCNRGLVERRRSGRARSVTLTLLNADGGGGPYVRPRGSDRDDWFIRLDHRYWSQEWDKRLSLPALAMLLVALHEKPGFALPTEKVPAWYGWSADTAERGFRELQDEGLLSMSAEVYAEPMSPTGLGSRNRYTVQSPFDPKSVDAAVKGNDKRRLARAKASRA